MATPKQFLDNQIKRLKKRQKRLGADAPADLAAYIQELEKQYATMS